MDLDTAHAANSSDFPAYDALTATMAASLMADMMGAQNNSSAAPAANSDAWNGWIDQLREWRNNPGMIESDEGVCVSQVIIHVALQSARRFATVQMVPPVTIAPDEDGGLVFHFNSSQKRLRLEFLRNGHVDLYQFINGTLVSNTRFR